MSHRPGMRPPGAARTRGLAAVLVLAVALAWVGLARPQGKAPAPPKPKTSAKRMSDTVVATVASRPISRSEFEARYQRQREQYAARSGAELAPEFVPIARRQVLEGLIQRELMQLEAERRGMLATENEAIEELKRDPIFYDGGNFNQARYDAVRTRQPEQFQVVVDQARGRIGARKLQEKLNRELAPPEAELKAEAERALTRASLSYLALRRAEFSGEFQEPRETGVLDEYKARRDALMRPERARLSIVMLDTPAPSDSVRGNQSAMKAWNNQMREKAVAALAAVRSGKTLEEATTEYGAPRRDVVVTSHNFPGFWRGDERLNRMLFSQPVGAVLPEPVPADVGWLLARVEERVPAQVAPLSEVSRRIRLDLRDRARRNAEDDVLRPIYGRIRDSLRTTGYRVRYAVADTGRVKLREPSAAELERYYRTHLADYSAFDPATTSVRARPLSEVREDVRQRLLEERRVTETREIANGIAAAWRKGKRDRSFESKATVLREVGPALIGAAADTGAAGRALGDSLARRAGALGVGLGPSPRGPMVFHVYEAVPDYVPTYEQARPMVIQRRDAERARAEEEGARALYDQDPMRFAAGPRMWFTRVTVTPPDILDVPLTRDEVERYHQEHIDRYSAPEMVNARHILIDPGAPGAEADERARAKAHEVLQRIRAGEDFATLARLYSEDPATRDKGGELGDFARGAMLEEFERAAFGLRVGEVSEPVRTREGYHIIQVLTREPAMAQPLLWIYGNVGGDAALEKGERIARARADSLFLVAGTPAKIRAAARKLGLPIQSMDHPVGSRRGIPELVDVLARLEGMKPGEMYPGPHRGQGKDFAFSWVDSFVPAARPSWSTAKKRAIEAYRASAGERAFEAKIAELDSLMDRGFGFDTVGALWGGLQKATDIERGQGIASLDATAQVDSLAFGDGKPPGLARGQVSGWLSLPASMARLRLDQRTVPDAATVGQRVENRRRSILERKLFDYMQELKKRHPVRILDRELEAAGLPEPRER